MKVTFIENGVEKVEEHTIKGSKQSKIKITQETKANRIAILVEAIEEIKRSLFRDNRKINRTIERTITMLIYLEDIIKRGEL